MNEQFLKRMQTLLGAEYDAYVKTLHNPPFRGLRANLLKIQPDALVKRQFASLSPSPFAREGFVLTGSETGLGNHIYHRQGLFYMQEPSASSAVTVLIRSRATGCWTYARRRAEKVRRSLRGSAMPAF